MNSTQTITYGSSEAVPEAETASTVELTSEPVSEATAEPESAVTSAPGSEVTPEVTSEPESEVTSEPKSEVTIEPVSEATSEPQSEVTSEPESEVSSQPESEVTSEPESEVTSVPESEVTSEPESEVTSEPESEVTSDPESAATSEPESEVTSEPESEVTSEPESEVTPEPESEATSEPESEATSEPESEVTSEPESEPKSEVTSEPESEVTSEPESEVTSEPESEATFEPESEATSEPESEATSEPESEATSEPESEATSEPESEASSEPESEATSEPESEATSEPESEATSEPESEASIAESEAANSEPEPESESIGQAESEAGASSEMNSTPEERPSAAEIVIPPVILIVAILTALVVLLIRSRRASINNTLFGVSRNFLETMITKKRVSSAPPSSDDIKVIDLMTASNEVLKVAMPLEEDEPFFTDFDLEVLQSLRNCYNQPKELIRIAIPAILSLALCPMTLYMFDPFRKFVWPESQYPSMPDINDAIACYLSPAGLVYATSFGFAFQQVLNKQHEILTKMTEEISMLDQIATFTIKLNLNLRTKLKILHAVKTECIFMVLQVLDRDIESYKYRPKEDIKVKIWSVVDLLREVDASRKNHVDRFLCERIFNHIMKLNSICSDRMGVLHTRIHPFKWVFLETLGFFSFLGILLLTAHSYRMELVMCVVTVFSISMLCYVVSDLDSPFSGFFRVDIGVLEEVLRRLDLIYEMAKCKGHVDVFYPE